MRQEIHKRFPFCRVEQIKRNGNAINEILLRLTPLCNQHCPFCSAEPINSTPSIEEIKACLDTACRRVIAPAVILTGGEPTIRKDFMDIVRYAVELEKIQYVQVQTNAVVIGLRPERFPFPDAPKLAFFVSLHSVEPSIYDACTGSQKQLPIAIRGIHILQEQGHRVTLNCVVNKMNLDHLDELVRAIPKLFDAEALSELHFSVLICPEYREEAADYLMPYPLLAEKLASACKLANKIGLKTTSLLSSTHASIPACFAKPELRKRFSFPEILKGDTGFEDFSKPWIKSRLCKKCVESPFCLGLPRPYVEKFGFEEVTPIEKLKRSADV